jgi:hypothetical protein
MLRKGKHDEVVQGLAVKGLTKHCENLISYQQITKRFMFCVVNLLVWVTVLAKQTATEHH